MKGLVIVISCVILVFLALDKSGAFRITTYTVTEGTLKIDKTRFEWHPEKLTVYLKTFSKKWREPLLKEESNSQKVKKTEKPIPSRLILKNGVVLKGYVIQKSEQGVLFQSEGGEVFFNRNEIASLETK